jgi:23S rRNA pseudouridine2605 synthase
VSEQPTDRQGERLQKVLARAGFGSRRKCEDLIRARRVTVNGRTAELGARVDVANDVVEVNGVRAAVSPDLVYLALHKPAGVVTTARDTRGRLTVIDLVPKEPRVFPIGRLDLETSGLLLLTNDGEFANHVAHPRYEVAKTYVAEVRGGGDAKKLRRLVRGVELEDGFVRATDARVQAASQGRAVVEVTVHEGRNRLVRRMLDAVGLEVTGLVRTSVGPVRLGRLKEGGWRNLKQDEIRGLWDSPSSTDDAPAPE